MKKVNLLLIVLIIFTVLAPLTFTQESFFSVFDFTNTGPIGDTIGGITSPFINFIAAILVYIAFKEQVNTNKKQDFQQSNERAFNTVINEINWSIEEYDRVEYKGAKRLDAIVNIAYDKDIEDSEVIMLIQKLQGLTNLINRYINITLSIDSDEYKAILASKILYIWRSRTKQYISRIKRYKEPFEKVMTFLEGEDLIKYDLVEMLSVDKNLIDKMHHIQKHLYSKNFKID